MLVQSAATLAAAGDLSGSALVLIQGAASLVGTGDLSSTALVVTLGTAVLDGLGALTASGLYSEAMVHVRRAFELSPQLIYRPLNHRASYTYPDDYDDHVERLQEHVNSHPDDDEAVILLAYQLFFSDTPKDATEPMSRVKELATKDGFARRLWEAAKPLLGDDR